MILKNLSNKNIENQISGPLRVLQFGEGNFLRAFAGWMIDIMNEKKVFNGKIVIVQPIKQGLCELINTQDGLYHVFSRGYSNGEYVDEVRLIRSVEKCLDPYGSFSDFIALARVESLDIIISNTTESGIGFMENDQFEDAPASTFPAKLTQLMYERYRHFKGDLKKGYTILPCELLEKNGDVLEMAVLKYAENWDLGADFIYWIIKANTFHNTLVDRIVPGYPRSNAEEHQMLIGFDDQLMVTAEHYYMWVIEGGEKLEEKLPFGKSGLNVKIVSDIAPYRERKVKMLNASHTAFCPVSLLYGCLTVREAVEDGFINRFIEDLLYGEIMPTLEMDDDEKRQFAHDVLQRFRNPSINHLLSSIALNSISKFKVRNLPSLINYHKSYGVPPRNLTFAMAALFVLYKGEFNGKVVPVNDDPKIMDFFRKAWKNNYKDAAKAILSNTSLWKANLSRIAGLTEVVAGNMEAIDRYGIEEGYNLLYTMEDLIEMY